MAYVKMRNKQTGEFRDVEADSPEHIAMKGQVTPSGATLWEQTGYHHADYVKERATYGELLEHELGVDAQEALKHEALQLDAAGVSPEANPHLALTPGEIEAGLTPVLKLEQIRTQYAPNLPTREAILSGAHEQIADGEVTPRQSVKKARGQRARAGGSDDRSNSPVVDAATQEESDDDGSGDSSPTQAELAAQATASGGGQGGDDGEE